MGFTTEIKKYLMNELAMDVVGIAPAEALKDEPKGYRPSDILPGARSVVVFGKCYPDGAVQSAFRKFEDGLKAAESVYSTYTNEICPNIVLMFDTFNTCQFIERTFGYTAVPLPSGAMQNAVAINTDLPLFSGPYKGGLPMSIKNAALAAGLGEIGWSTHFLTPEFGPRIQLGALITNLELDYDKPYDGPRLCKPEKCGVCSSLCPTHAISAEKDGGYELVSAGGKTCKVTKFVPNRCYVAAMALRKEYEGAYPVSDVVGSDDPSDGEIAAALKARPINDYTYDHYPKFYCDKCLIYCPVGNWKERFADKGLSRAEGGSSI